MSTHRCHATGCDRAVPPRMFMCKPHWFRLPKGLRDEIWRHYRPGQERMRNPSRAYLKAARRAVEWLEEKEKPAIQQQLPWWLKEA